MSGDDRPTTPLTRKPMPEATCATCGHGWYEHYPPSLNKSGISCTHTLFTAKGADECTCPKFVAAVVGES